MFPIQPLVQKNTLLLEENAPLHIRKVVSGQKIEFSFMNRKLKVYKILSTGVQEVQPATILQKVSCKEQLLYLLSSSQMRLSKGAICTLSCDPVLLGGGSYLGAFEKLHSYLQEALNPVLVNEVLEVLEKKFQGGIDYDNDLMEGFGVSFGSSWPVKLQQVFVAYIEATTAHVRCTTAEEMGRNRGEILEHLKQLQTMKRDYKKIWPELLDLLNIPHIKRLESDKIDDYIRELLGEEPKRESLLKIVQLFTKEQLEEIVSYLREVKCKSKTLQTVVLQALKKKPQSHPTGILNLWDSDESFFLGKTLSIEGAHDLYQGEIDRVERSPNKLVFNLTDHSLVTILKTNCSVQHIKREFYSLPFVLMQSHMLAVQSEFEIAHDSLQEKDLMFSPGIYRLVERSFHSKNLLTGHSPYVKIKIHKLGTKMQYSLNLFHSKKSFELKGVEWERKDSDQTIAKGSLPLTSFRKYRGIKREKKYIKGITKLDEQVKVLNEQSTYFKRDRAIKEQIDKKFSELKKIIKKERAALESLLKEYVNNQCEKIETIPLGLEDSLRSICEDYKALGSSFSPLEILLKIALEINCELIVEKEGASTIANMMDLLSNAQCYIDQLEDKPIILVMGFTGSGKSSAICHFLGGDIGFDRNAGNDISTVLKQSDNSADFPKIGASLGKSETLYPQGYPIFHPEDDKRQKPYMIVDSPGFNDTRGEDYNLCASLSMDEVFKKSGSIQSIVITVPIQIFSSERANHLIELIDTIEERFPQSFDPDCTDERLFLLITKREQVGDGIVEGIEGRLQRHLLEAKEYVDELHRKKISGDPSGGLELYNAERRKRIWQALNMMFREGRISAIDYQDDIETEEQLSKYVDSTRAFNKQRYRSVLEDSFLQKQLEDYIEEAAHTWRHYFFDQYLDKFSADIEGKNQEKKDKLTSQQTQQSALTSLEQEKENLIKWERELTQPEKNLDSVEFTTLLEKINAAALQELETSIAHLETLRKQFQESYSLCSRKIEDLEPKHQLLEKNVSSLAKKIAELQDPDTPFTESIRHFAPKASDSLLLAHLKDERSMQNSVEEVRDLRQEETAYQKSTTAGEFNQIQRRWYHVFTGMEHRRRIRHHIYVNRNYRLVSEDADVVDCVQRAGDLPKWNLKGFFIRLTGNKYEYEMGKATPCGKMMKHIVTTVWDGENFPNFDFTVTIPSHIYHRAAIDNLQAELRTEQENLKECQREMRLDGSSKTIYEYKEELKRREEKFQKEIETLKSKKNSMTVDLIREYIAERKIEVDSSIEMMQSELSNLAIRIDGLSTEIQQLNNKKREYAIAIWTQHKSASTLKSFCELLLKRTAKETLQEQCEKFIKLYDSDFRNLLEETKRDVNIC